MTPTTPPEQRRPPDLRSVSRIRDRRTFAAFRHGRRARRGPLSVCWVPAAEFPAAEVPAAEGGLRVAYAIGRLTGGAVLRNRIRRRLRAAVAEEAGRMAAGAYLVGATAEAADLGAEELQSTLSELIKAVTLKAGTRP